MRRKKMEKGDGGRRMEEREGVIWRKEMEEAEG